MKLLALVLAVAVSGCVSLPSNPSIGNLEVSMKDLNIENPGSCNQISDCVGVDIAMQGMKGTICVSRENFLETQGGMLVASGFVSVNNETDCDCVDANVADPEKFGLSNNKICQEI